jgi:hypothetical protein
MNTANPAALLRSLIIYAVVIPLAIVVGYLMTNPLDYESLGFMGVLIGVMVSPLLMRWHYELLVFSWGLPSALFFLPSRPSFFIFMVVVSLTISIVERILNRNQPFLPATPVRWPLFFLIAVVIMTAKLTGGFGLRSAGSDNYGGKKYIIFIINALSFFAVTARPIPRKRANFYIGLFFLGGCFNAVGDLYPIVPSPLRFIYMVFPASNSGVDASGSYSLVLGQTRLGGVGAAAGACIWWLLARHGMREGILTAKLWRPMLFGLLIVLTFLGGFRSAIIGLLLVLAVFFYCERIYRTGAMLVVIMGTLLGGALLVPLAPHLPYTFQRALAFTPLDIDPAVRIDAEGSSEWRLAIWKALLPEVPKYLLLGKGYTFSAETFNATMGADSMFKGQTFGDASQENLAIAGDFHNGPLSVVIPFGIWGAIGWLWFVAACGFVVWRNYCYGDPELGHINLLFLALFISKCVMFFVIVGSMVDDTSGFAGVAGLSVAINHGIMGRRTVSQAKTTTFREFATGRRAMA